MSYLIRVRVGENVSRLITEENTTVTVGSGDKDVIYFEQLPQKQLRLCIKEDGLHVSAKDISDLSFLVVPKAKGTKVSKEKDISIFWNNYEGASEESFKMPFTGIVTVGRKPSNTIVINNKKVSGCHITLRCEDGNVRLEDGVTDKPSSNGVYVNGRKMSVAMLKSGDVIDVEEFRIIFKNMTLTFENVGDRLSINPIVDQGEISLKSKKMDYRRSARERRALPSQVVVLDRAPAKMGKFQKRKGMFTSLVSSGAMIGVSMATGMASPALLAARAAGMAAPLVNIGFAGSDNKKNKKEWEKAAVERREKYGEYIEGQLAKINFIAEEQQKILSDENPEPKKWQSVVDELNPRLWERRPIDSDFLSVRLGMGYEDLCVDVKTQSEAGFQMEEDEVEKLAQEIKEETRIVDNIPLRLDMEKFKTIGMVGDRGKVVSLLKNILISLTAAHYYEDVRIVGIFDKEEAGIWDSLRWLPHFWDAEKQTRFLAFDKEYADKIDEAMDEMIRQRLEVVESYNKPKPAPHYIFIFGSYDYVKKSKVLGNLLRNSEDAGATALFAYRFENKNEQEQMTYLPPECQFVINTEGVFGPCAYEFCRANKKAIFTMDDETSAQEFDSFCRTMSAINVIDGAGKQELPNGITFLEGLDTTNVNEIDVWRNWNDKSRKEILKSTIGVMTNGKQLTIDIGDLAQPPITLVGGMSGSGKSEFLKTMILSLALNHSPEELEMVIIDYKGGSMAASVEKLPHITGKITDIAGDIMRPLQSLSYEIHRRKLLFDDLGIQDYKAYSKLKKNDPNIENLPMMLIICDEFAELKQQHREFMDNLVEIARQGRSLGVRLVLATQSPAGVVSQDLVDNSRFQICLKVQNASASKSLINRPDAARITQNGRAYVRAGSDEIFELIQSFWAGATYYPDGKQKTVTGNQVRIVDISGKRINPIDEEKPKNKNELSEQDALIQRICDVAEEHGIKRRQCPWKSDLPKLLDITQLDVEGGFDGCDWRPASFDWFKLPIGIYDIPERQEQGVQFIDFEKESHYGFYGLPGTGKTALLKTVIMQAGRYYKPDEVNIYILDLGSHTMRMFEKMPHVAAVALASEEEKIAKIATYLEKSLNDRKRKFAECGVSSYKSYKENFGNDFPAIILAVDNFIPLLEVSPAFDPLIYQIGSEGASLGIYLVYTANSNNGIRYKLTSNIYSGISFEMGDRASYTELVGKVDNPNALQKSKGRAFFKSNVPIIFQAAVYGQGPTELDWQKWAKHQIELMNEYWDGEVIETVPEAPAVVTVEDLNKHYTSREIIPVGCDAENGSPVFINTDEYSTLLVVGTERDRQTSFVSSLAQMIKTSAFEQELYIIDGSNSELNALKDMATKYLSISDIEDIDNIQKQLINELISRQQKYTISLEDGSNMDKQPLSGQFSQILLLIGNFEEFADTISENDGVYRRFNALCKNALGLGLYIIASGESDKIKELQMTNGVVSNFVQNQMGIVVSGTADKSNFLIQNNLEIEDRIKELDSNNCILFENGQARKIVSFI